MTNQSIFFLILIHCLVSCNSKKNRCSNGFDEIYKIEKNKFSLPIKDSAETILRDTGINNGEFGGEYIFHVSGKIKQYRFFSSGLNYTYAEYFDQNGILTHIEGNPIMLSNIEEINRDSINLNFFISTLKKKIKIFSIRVNNSQWVSLKLNIDSTFSNAVRFVYPLNTRNTENIEIFERLVYTSCNGEEIISVDSLHTQRLKE